MSSTKVLMDMSDSSLDSSSSQISMLWNWYTVDTCFLSTSRHNRTKGMFAGSVIGIFCLVIVIEFVRRLGREYDRILIKAAQARGRPALLATRDNVDETCKMTTGFQPSLPQQLVRAIAYGSQFTAAFLVMLLGMYYNGFILFAIFIGQTVSFFLVGRDTCTTTIDHATAGHCC